MDVILRNSEDVRVAIIGDINSIEDIGHVVKGMTAEGASAEAADTEEMTALWGIEYGADKIGDGGNVRCCWL